ncbi:DUF2971 domain-containing protein [Carboxylicivirga caseinilyticus]|uniref:DUF2971 domain-containing protein n=1 Tax=Carboxylicivirga caseinilyticus TaxID=3417572 RepID=UPI003D35670D|nr:DUF2971 domain-containing protein [Marinilabiliaceae bacterium A049]
MDNNILYHYTSVDTFLKIFKEGTKNICLRATHAAYFNDPYEGKYTVELLEESFRKYEEDNNIKERKQGMNQLVINFIHSALGEPYLLSFSEHPDSLTMWRAYGDNGNGIAIGFDKYVIGSNPEEKPNVNLIDCLYDESKIKAILQTHWDKVYNNYKINEGKTSYHGSPIFPIYNKFYFGFKRKEYAIEAEWRLCQNVHSTQTKKHRVSNGLIIPYVEHIFPQEAIKKIVLGPCLDPEKSKKSVADFAKYKGLHLNEETDIIISKVSYRNI